MSDEKDNISEASEGIIKMSIREKSDLEDENSDNEDENSQEDIEALKAATKANQRKLSRALNQARKAEKAKAKPIVSLLANYPKFLVKWQALGPNNCCAPLKLQT